MLRIQVLSLDNVQFFSLPSTEVRTPLGYQSFKVVSLVNSYTHQCPESGDMTSSLESIGVVIAVVAVEQQLEHILSAKLRTVHRLVDVGTRDVE